MGKPEKSMIVKKSAELNFDRDTVELIKKTVAVGANDNELKLFLYQSQRTGLDPLARQIYFVKRGTKITIQTSIDGFRVVAERSGNYAGQDEPKFEEGTPFPKKCTVTVYKFDKEGTRYPAAYGVAYWEEYVPPAGQDFMWKKMPHTMLSKVAEALALRKAFPQDLSGLYTDEEMDQSKGDGNSPEEGKLVDGKKETPDIPPAEDGKHEVQEESSEEERVCKMHLLRGQPTPLTNRGQGIWDHRRKLNEKQEFDPKGNWYYCQGHGWHLSSVQ